MRNLAIILTVILLSVTCCGRKDKVQTFNPEKPYSLEIKKERSYFQAEKIASRLNEMGMAAYVIEKNDSAAGKWFYVLSGALENIDSVSSYKERIAKEFRLPDLRVVDYNDLDSASKAGIIRPNTVLEKERISAEKPNLPEDVFETIKKYPHNNTLYLEQINLVYFPEGNRDKGLEVLKKERSGLFEKSVSKKLLAAGTTYTEGEFIDNLYGDRMTMRIVKLNPRKQIVTASLAPVSHDEQFRIAEEYADLLLNSGSYESENKTKTTINAYVGLYGYKVRIGTGKEVWTYYILVDENCEYIYFSQSTDKTEKEILKLLSEVGKGDGLLEYNEFYNSFNVIPDNSGEKEIFLGLFVNKLTSQYAKAKNDAKWAQEMVGHWRSATYFNNTEKGIWSYTIFDLLTEKKQRYIEALYTSRMSKDCERNIYGGTGYAKYHNYPEYDNRKYLVEVSFYSDRFICAIKGSPDFKEEDLILRGENIQFKKGGYQKKKEFVQQ